MKQYEAVIRVMEENGGYATLSYLYKNVLKVEGVVWKTKTPFASIRRIVQVNKSFFNIKPGLWALEDYKERLPDEIRLMIEDNQQKEEGEGYNHSFYQGIVVEIGNIFGYKTYIPPQDRNKKFLPSITLGELISLKKIYRFTYNKIIKK
ncbi:MAG: hypothetical protein ACUVWP_04190 [bacterium]